MVGQRPGKNRGQVKPAASSVDSVVHKVSRERVSSLLGKSREAVTLPLHELGTGVIGVEEEGGWFGLRSRSLLCLEDANRTLKMGWIRGPVPPCWGTGLWLLNALWLVFCLFVCFPLY